MSRHDPEFGSPIKVTAFVAAILLGMLTLTLVWPNQNPHLGPVEIKWKNWGAFTRRQVVKQVDLAALEAQRVRDSLQMLALKNAEDSIRVLQILKSKNPAQIYLPAGQPELLDAIFAQLDSLEQQQQPAPLVRIMHWGDSQIETDRISNAIRNVLQSRFGGIGPGFLPIQQNIPSGLVNQTAAGDMQRFALWDPAISNNKRHPQYGPLLSHTQMLAGTVDLKITKGSMATTASGTFNQFQLLTGGRESELRMTTSTGHSEILPAGAELQTFRWETPDSLRQIHISVQCDFGGAVLYGVSLNGNSGVVVDNLPMRGCSGTLFTRAGSQSMARGLSDLGADLLLLEFGGNSIPYLKQRSSLCSYAANIGRQIDFLKRNRSEAAIIFLGPGDMAQFTDGRWQSYPILPEMVGILKDTVLAHGAAYFDMMAAMGGVQSMVAWVEASPPLATGDYIHYTSRGAGKMGRIFTDALLQEYALYLSRKNAKTLLAE